MKKLFTTILLSLCIGLPLLAQTAQDSIGPPLLFTEWSRTGSLQTHYYELTNMADTAIDLYEFTMVRAVNNQLVGEWPNPNDYRTRMDFRNIYAPGEKILEPGECVTIMPVYERYDVNEYSFFYGKNVTRVPFKDSADILSYMQELTWDDEEYRIENELPKDSVDTYLLHRGNANEWVYTYWRDTVPCDAITNVLLPSGRADDWRFDRPVAGIEFPQDNYTMVRKFDRNIGSFDWNKSRGLDATDSWWIPVYYDWNNGWNPSFFTTIGVHGDFSIDFSSETLTIDHTAKTITVPWGIRKGTWNVALNTSKGIINEIDFGPGMAYRYIENSDTASSAVMLGDTLWMYATGNDLETAAYAIIPEDATASDAVVLPKRFKYEDEENNNYSFVNPTGAWRVAAFGSNLNQMQCRFHVTEHGEAGDSITFIPFAERVDTLYKYLEKAPDATWEIDWVDDMERVDLKEGDKLVVTAGDGSTKKEYYLSLRPIIKSDNSLLSAITWPDGDVDDTGWDSDTIPGFSPTKYQYNIEVPYGSKNIPALHYFKADGNANATMTRATTLAGSLEDRSTTITVISNSLEDTTVYKVIFKAEIRTDDIQPFFAEPIITEYVNRLWARMSLTEITNVGNQPLDLGKYMLVGSTNSPATAIQNYVGTDSVNHWRWRWTKYIPGKKYSTYQYWAENPGMVIDDPDILPILAPGESFMLGNFRSQAHDPEHGWYVDPSHWDVQWSGLDFDNSWGEKGAWFNAAQHGANSAWSSYIFKIVGDSILDGTKGIYDVEDFELIDGFGDFADGLVGPWNLGGVDYPPHFAKTYRRNPDNYYPATIPTADLDSGQVERWTQISSQEVGGNLQLLDDTRNFTHDPITEYMSTVASTTYVVKDGYEGDLDIKGILSGTTSADFIGNLIPAHEDQALSVISFSSAAILADGDAVSANDTLKVISADGENTTKYAIVVGPLDSDATLVAADGSGYTIDVDGAAITGIPLDVTIEAVLNNVEVPSLATLNVIDATGNLIPLQTLDLSDSTYTKNLLIGEVYFEVIAQDGTTIKYLLSQGILSSDAFLTSYAYEVDQEKKLIVNVILGLDVENFLAKLVPSGNATLMILDKAGFERDSGIVALDDLVRVTSEDQSNTVDYQLWVFGEDEPDRLLGTEAFVTSDVYTVNEELHTISEIPAYTEVAAFLANLSAAEYASVKLVDASENDKATGEVVSDDKVVVTSEDGETTVTYTLDVLASTRDHLKGMISIYPNPAKDVLFINGAPRGSSIHLISITGQVLQVLEADAELIEVSVEDLAKGYYIINVTDSQENFVPYRFVKQ